MIETQESKESAPAPAPARGQKLWAVLLVLDSFFVIIFGGALAAKVYQHWQAPPPPPMRRPRPVTKAQAEKPLEPPKTEASTLGDKATPNVPKGGSLPAAEAPKGDAPRPPKPSLLHEAPRREAAKPQGQADSAPAAPGAVVKAVPVEFHYKGQAKRVELVGAFIVRGGRKSLAETEPGHWALTLYLTPNTYRYYFDVNGKKTLDPSSGQPERGMSVKTVVPPAP